MDDRVTAIFGEVDLSARQFAVEFAETILQEEFAQDPQLDQYGYSRAHMECASIAVITELHPDELSLVAQAQPSPELVQSVVRILQSLTDGLRRCSVDDFSFTAMEVLRAGFGQETIDCTRDEVGDATRAADVLEAFAGTIFDEDPSLQLELEATANLVRSAVEACYTEEEQDVFDEWSAWLDSPFIDPLVGESDFTRT